MFRLLSSRGTERAAVGLLALGLLLILMGAAPALAVPTTVTYEPLTPSCDPIFVPSLVDELGTAPLFPADELIASKTLPTMFIPCPPANLAAVADPVVEITNLTGRSFKDVWWVSDPETLFTNVDGKINGRDAFKIDAVGGNVPLIFESFLFDGIFSAGEIWHFSIQDYSNGLGLPPSALGSIGVPSVGDVISSGSIIAVEVPEPASLALLGLACAALAGLRRRSAQA